MAKKHYHDPAVKFIMDGKLKIEDKDGKLVVFKPSPIQRHVLDLIEWFRANNMAVRLIILKARQIGATTVIAAYLYAKARVQENQSILVAANMEDACDDIWDQKYRQYLESDEDQPPTSKNSVKELKFKDTGSKINIRVGGPDLGRGGTRQHCHLTELPFFKDADRSWSVLKPCLPDSANTSIFWESTASMPDDLFERGFYAAQKAEEEGDESYPWRAVFFPWTAQEEYQIKNLSQERADKLRADLDEYEKQLFEEGVTLNQLAWRRQVEKEMGADEFRKAYPYTPEEAFSSRRNSIFANRSLRWLDDHMICEPNRIADVKLIKRGQARIITSYDDEAPLHIWHAPNPSHTYTIGADPATEYDSQSASKSAAAIIENETGTLVATYINKLDHEEFADHIMALGWYYNTAHLVPETNQGQGVLMRLKQMKYPRIYRRRAKIDGVSSGNQRKIGMHMDAETRSALITKFQAIINQRRLRLFCARLHSQMQTFVKISGKVQAQSGANDDLVLATGMAVLVASQDHDWQRLDAEGMHQEQAETGFTLRKIIVENEYAHPDEERNYQNPFARAKRGGSIYA